jgi:Pyruvate/2-oxoacid:ferredoxin oxidoreductase delta subunit
LYHKNAAFARLLCKIVDKAIRLEPVEVPTADGEMASMQVIRERCIGCGICDYKCPLEGEAAIRMYTPQI